MSNANANGHTTGAINDPAQNKAVQLISPLIPADAEDRVRRTVKQWNQIVREHIRNETRLGLTDGDARKSISVTVTEGFPQSLARLIHRHDDPVLWRIIVGQSRIGGIIDGLQYLLENWSEFQNWIDLPAIAVGAEPSMRRTVEVATALQKLVVANDVRREIQEIEEDILGVYRFSTRSVELYWIAIAMVAAALNVQIEDLTVVTLVHELAHGYTHVGQDVDGQQWSDLGIRGSSIYVIEGLAQFYTELVVNRLAVRVRGPQEAFWKLLELQSAPYQTHLEWLADRRAQRGEIVRFALIAARSHGATSLEFWNELLHSTRIGLSRSPYAGSRRNGQKLFET